MEKHSTISEMELSNLFGRPLRVAAVELDGSYRLEKSFAVELLKALEFTMNFTTIPVITNFWGHLDKNESWTGMIKLLLEEKADFGLSSIADRPFRRTVVDFNIPTNEIRLSAFFQKPSAISSNVNALIKPFQSSFWIGLIFVLFAMIGTSFAISHLVLTSEDDDDDEDGDTSWTLSDCILWSLTSITLRGFYKAPHELSLRITAIVGSVSGLIILSSYSGTLVSFLSVVTEPIQNLAQLLASDFTIVVVDEPLPLQFLSESPDAKSVMLYSKRRTDKSFSTMTKAYDEINKGSFVFVVDHTSAYESLNTDFSIHEACTVREIEIENAQQKQGTLVSKNSPYKRIIDYQILRTIQTGLVKRWSKTFLKQKPTCESQNEYQGVEFLSASFAFIILLSFGIIGGTVFLWLELWCHKQRDANIFNWTLA